MLRDQRHRILQPWRPEARTKESTFDLGFGEEVHGNRCSKEGLLISGHKHMLAIVPGAVPEGIEKTEEYHRGGEADRQTKATA